MLKLFDEDYDNIGFTSDALGDCASVLQGKRNVLQQLMSGGDLEDFEKSTCSTLSPLLAVLEAEPSGSPSKKAKHEDNVEMKTLNP